MHIIKQIGKVVADIEHTPLGVLTMKVVAQELPPLETDALHQLVNALIGGINDELQARGLL